ncbi:hypothetical protein [Lysinibacillus fusiformis]|uniref:hypothetical protein n=1 Tax=Lysinibacillus fusiformis TaxID=28031 RepID=UPI0036F0F626
MGKIKTPPKKKEPQHPEQEEFDLEETQKVMSSVWFMKVLLFFLIRKWRVCIKPVVENVY